MKLEKIHEDDRGSINIVTGLNIFDEITLFKTNKNYARGGCVHNINDEYLTVIEGRVLYVIGDDEKILTPGISKVIPRGTPHYFISLTDSIVMEFGATTEEKQTKHKEFRKIVDEVNQKKV